MVRSGKVVTAAGVSAGIDLALFLAGEIAGRQRAEAVQLTIEYDPHPPFDAGHMSKASKETQGLAREIMDERMPADQRRLVPRIALRRFVDLIRRRIGRCAQPRDRYGSGVPGAIGGDFFRVFLGELHADLDHPLTITASRSQNGHQNRQRSRAPGV